MEEQEKQASTVRNVVILVGCAFAALFVAMVVVMAIRGARAQASESDYSVTYTMSPPVAPVAFVPQPDLVTYTMSPTASTVAFVPRPGTSASGGVRYGQVFHEAPVSTSYRLTVTPPAPVYTFQGAPYGASYKLWSPIVYYHTSTGEKTVTGADPEEKKK